MIQDHPILYSRTSSGAIQTWKMQFSPDEARGAAYRSVSGLTDGKKTESGWKFPKSKNIGKSNETSPSEQAEKEIAAKYVKKKKQANFEDMDRIDDYVFFEPMLAHKFKERDAMGKIEYPVYVQRKLDGTRSVRHTDGIFSRTGERYFCTDHIVEATKMIVKDSPHGKIDGEFYRHGLPLSDITSLVSVNRKEKDVTQEDRDRAREIIEYHVYDCVGIGGLSEDATYDERKAMLAQLLRDVPYVKLVETDVAHNYEEVMALFAKYVEEGYEGAIIRTFDGVYKNGRSYDLLKLKAFMDEEFEVVDIESGTGNWDGCAKRIICKILAKGIETTFASNVEGTMPVLKDLLENKEKYIGKKATVKFLNYSVHEIPVIPYTKLPFRDYE